MNNKEQTEIELAYAERAEHNAARTDDPHMKAEWLEQARQARELAARLAEEAAQP